MKSRVYAKEQSAKNPAPVNTSIDRNQCNETRLPWYLYLVPPSILSVATFLFYLPSRNYDFQFDDIANITKYYDIRHNNLRDLFFTGPRWIARWINSIHYSIGKFEPYSYRLANIVQHIVIGVIIYFLFLVALKSLKKNSFFKDNALILAFLTSAFFMLHPVQTQTVSYVIQGKLEGVATLFIAALALLFVMMTQARSTAAKIGYAVAFFALSALSTGSKEIAIAGPFLIILIDWFLVSQGSWQSFKERIFFHVTNLLLIGSLYIYLLELSFFKRVFSLQWDVANNLGNVITNQPLEHITPFWYFMSEFKVVLHYLAVFLWPFNMSVEYDWVLSKSFFALDCFVPFLILTAIVAYLVYLVYRNQSNLIVFGMLWFFICVLPRSSLISSAELIVDYKTYAASVGWLFVLACVLVAVVLKIAEYIPTMQYLPSKVVRSFGLCVLCLALGYLTLSRNTVWRTGIEFWGDVLKNAPGKARIYNNYGVELSQKLQKFEESIAYFQKAISMDAYYPDPHNNLAVVYAYLNKFDLAIQEMQAGLRINPYYAEGYNNLAAFYLHIKELDRAKRCLDHALAIRPSYGKAYFNRARIYSEQGNIDLALADLKSACTVADLDNEFGFSVYGKLALDNKRFDDAVFAYTKLVECSPNNFEGYFNLGNALHMVGKYTQAVCAYERSLALNPSDARCVFNLGETYFKLNDDTKAISYFEKINCAQAPLAGLRKADCYIRLGNNGMAQQILNDIVRLPVADDIKDKARQTLASINIYGQQQAG